MIGCGISPKHCINTEGTSLLMQAISLRSLEVMEWITRNISDYPRWHQAIIKGAAHSAVEESQWEMAKCLVEYETDISAKDIDG